MAQPSAAELLGLLESLLADFEELLEENEETATVGYWHGGLFYEQPPSVENARAAIAKAKGSGL